jgi:hypothetical protein
MVLADLVPGPPNLSRSSNEVNAQPPAYKRIDLAAEQNAPPRFVVVFVSDTE